MIKLIINTFILLLYFASTKSQTIVQMDEVNGVYFIPCNINGLDLDFIFDTGASNVCISLTEALFMYKNGYLSNDDILGTEYYQIANGELTEGTVINIISIKIGDIEVHNVKASVIHSIGAPLLLGQSVLSEFGSFTFNYQTNELVISNSNQNKQKQYSISNQRINNSSNKYSGYYIRKANLNNPQYEPALKESPSQSSLEICKIPKDAVIYILDENDDNYFEVYVNGNKGFLRKFWIKQ